MRLALFVVLVALVGCDRKPVTRASSLVPASPPRLFDDLPLGPLADALDGQIARLRAVDPPLTPFVYGSRELTKEEQIRGLERLRDIIRNSRDKEAFLSAVERDFEFYEVAGQKRRGEAFLTSYYEPVIPASRVRTDRFSSPLLKKPADLLEIAVDEYDARFRDIRRMRGRLSEKPGVSGTPRVVPYYTREEIENGALAGKRLEIAWVDPLDGFVLQIQGSGTLELEDGRRIRVGYSDENGHVYQAIGKFLTEVIPLRKMTLLSIEAHLRGLSGEAMHEILNRNPSYVFFHEREGEPVTSLGVPATAGRTIATDSRLFPKGAIAYLSFSKPILGGENGLEPRFWAGAGRIVLDQDTGGAIKGPGRLDLFWGRGEEAKRYASAMKQSARLYYLAPKAEWLSQGR